MAMQMPAQAWTDHTQREKLTIVEKILHSGKSVAAYKNSTQLFNCSRAGPARGENEPHVGRGLSTPSNERRWPPGSVESSWSEEGAQNQTKWSSGLLPRVMLVLRRSHLHCFELVQCAAWTRPDDCQDELLYRAVDIERHTGPKRALPSRGRDVLVQDVLPTTAHRSDVPVAEFEKYLRVRDIHGLEEVVNHGLNELGHPCVQSLRTCFTSGTFGPGQAGTLFSGLRRRSCCADLDTHQSVFRTLWRVHRDWSRHPCRVQNTSVS